MGLGEGGHLGAAGGERKVLNRERRCRGGSGLWIYKTKEKREREIRKLKKKGN